MKPIPYDTKPDDTLLQEMAEIGKIKVEDGVEYDDKSLLTQQWLEGYGQDCPATLIDENVPWRFWKLIASRIKALCRRTVSDSLRQDREVALYYVRTLVKNRVDAMTPARAQMDLFDLLMLSIPEGTPEGDVLRMRGRIENVLRCFREACYVGFQNEYLGRKVG